MHRKAFILGAACLVLSLFVLSAATHAKSSNSTVNTELEAELVPCALCTEPGAEGEAEFKSQTQKGVVKSKTFKAEVEIPIPNALGITDAATAQAAAVHLLLSRVVLGVLTQYADCTLAFTEIEQEVEDDDDEGELETNVEYKVDLRLKKGVLQSKKGSCVVDLVNGTLGIPDVQAGDVATVFVNGVQVLEGTFGLDD